MLGGGVEGEGGLFYTDIYSKVGSSNDGCSIVHRQDANTTTTEHSSCAQQYLTTVEMVEHNNALAEIALHVNIEQWLNL